MTSRFGIFNKKGIVMMMLSRELLAYSPGDRIDTIASYTKKFDTSRGVVQDVLNILENEKAISRAKRGTLGTYLEYIDYKKLWEFTSWGILTGVSPLPYTKKHEGLATAIYDQMGKKDIPFHFAYMQGAENRVQGVLQEKYDFAILSKESGRILVEKYNDLDIAMEFAPYSYISGYALIYKDEEVFKKKNIKVGRDLNSPDHVKWLKHLTEGKEVEFIDLQYTRMVPAIMEGTIDMTIYNKDTIEKSEITKGVEFMDVPINEIIGDETRAVLVVNNKSYGINNLLRQVIHMEAINKIQKEVMDNIRIPVY